MCLPFLLIITSISSIVESPSGDRDNLAAAAIAGIVVCVVTILTGVIIMVISGMIWIIRRKAKRSLYEMRQNVSLCYICVPVISCAVQW